MKKNESRRAGKNTGERGENEEHVERQELSRSLEKGLEHFIPESDGQTKETQRSTEKTYNVSFNSM